MRLVIWTFLVFVCSALLLLPLLNLGCKLPTEYSFYPIYSLIALSFLLQLECLSYIKMKGSYARLNSESKENGQLKSSLEKLKKKNSEVLRNQGRLEKKLLKTEGERDSIKDDLKMKTIALKDEKALLLDLKKSLKELKNKKESETHVITLLSLLQENGRFLDFLMDDITSYNDEQVGAASRIVHQGCVKVLKDYFKINPVFNEEEGSEIKISEANKNIEYRFVGEENIANLAQGKLLHKGWKTDMINLPKNIETEAVGFKNIITPAEIEAL